MSLIFGIEDLLRLDHHLPLFLREAVLHEDVDVGDEVEGDALRKLLLLDLLQRVERLGLAVELVHAVLAGAGDRLVGRDDDALDGGVVMQGLEGDDELRGRAVRVGDDALLLDVAHGLGVHLRDHEGHVGVVAPGGGVVDHDRALRGDAGRPFLGDLAAGGHEAEVHVGEIVGVEGLGLQGLVAEGDSRRPGCGGRRAPPPRRPGRPARRGCPASRGPHCRSHRRRRPCNPWIFSCCRSPRRIQDPRSGVASRPVGETTGDDETARAAVATAVGGFRFARRAG